jgi:branched-chain amino acid transport system permease protein
MSFALLFEQLLNGLQFGVTLFLMAAGLTLVFGIMNFINLAHGSLYMVGAYLTLAAAQWTGSYLVGVFLGLAGTLLVGMIVEVVALRALYDRFPDLTPVGLPTRRGTRVLRGYEHLPVKVGAQQRATA